MKPIFAIARKELRSYFGSPTALIFLGIFLIVTAFTFFWSAGFFARGLADIRPLFRWMPMLLIFLVAALTMRQWSEEQRSGTLELLMTMPITRGQALLGKFLAVMALVTLALALTLPIPVAVALLGPLDWGPVLGGYLASLLLAAAYTAIGLFMSALTDNQIVALLLTAVVGGLVYLAGAPLLVDFAGAGWQDLLRSIGTGSRFESIERGVLDLRDLVYYGTLTALFLLLTLYTLDRKRWSAGERTAAYRRGATVGMSLLAANLLLLNVWLAPLAALRVDMTAQQSYTLAPATRDLLASAQEPLLIRAYISQESHPLLDPLRPQVEDMLREYAIAGGDRVTAEVIDPAQNPELEAEANQVYGIQPTPFQVADRYQAALINAYFDILVRYGDQDTVLNFRDLIQVEQQPGGAVEVNLRNLEYDLTSAIKKAIYGFQSAGSVLAAQNEPVQATLYVTPATLPPDLAAAPATFAAIAGELATQSGGKLQFTQVDPFDPASGVNGDELFRQYGLQPLATSLFSPDTFYLHLVIENPNTADNGVQVIYPQTDMSEGALRTAIDNAILRTATGFLPTVGLWTAPATPTQDMFGQMQPPLQTYNLLRDQLAQNYTVRTVDLSSGQPPAGIDLLLLVAPQNLDDKARYAVDQFLMRGGAVVVLAGNYAVQADQFSGQLALQPLTGTLADLLRHYGVEVPASLVMDLQNLPFPVQTVRDAGGFQVQEIQAVNYPFFVDVRSDGMDRSGVAGSVPNVTVNWTSPVSVSAAAALSYTVETLLQSSPNAWLRTSTDIQPNFDLYPELGFPMEGAMQREPLAVALQGSFPSFFAGKPNPVTQVDAGSAITGTGEIAATVTQAPEDARLVVLGSGEFVNDFVLQLGASLVGEQVLNNLQYVQNVVDWALEDTDLLSLRSRGVFTRLLTPLDAAAQQRWELLTYALMALGYLGVAAAAYFWRRGEQPMPLLPRSEFKDLAPIGGQEEGA